MSAPEALLAVLEMILEVFGPALVRRRVDEWEAARAPSDLAFQAKFHEKP
jgi:hypothetical protein